MYKEITPEMKELIYELRIAYQGFWHVDVLAVRIGERVMGNKGGIPEIRKDLKRIETNIGIYKKALRACEKQLELEAAEIYSLPDLPRRIKARLVRHGCRTRMDVHMNKLSSYNTPGFGRKSEQVLRDWSMKHWTVDYDQWNEEKRRKDEQTQSV